MDYNSGQRVGVCLVGGYARERLSLFLWSAYIRMVNQFENMGQLIGDASNRTIS